MPSERVDAPEDLDDYPFDARVAVIAEQNTAADVRAEINDIVGLSTDPSDDPTHLAKSELVQVLLALGGPQRRPAAADGGVTDVE